MSWRRKKIYIILSMSGTKFSKFLRFMKPSFKYPHVSISLDKDLKTFYSFGRQNVTKFWIAGFVEEHPNTGIYAIFDSSCEVLEVEVEREQYEEIENLIQKFKRNIQEYHYNFFGLMFTYLKIPRSLNNRFTCTQFVAWVLTNCNVKIVNKPTSLILPTDYYQMPKSKIIYTGKLNQYNSITA